ncbi:putative UvrABC system protein A [Pillotina sp. SPG140]|jgi:excinuclease ABC subunit A
MQCISVKNANTNNLKNVSIDIPLNKYVVFMGKSGSGKSTLAADVIVGGYFNHSERVSVPIEPALFRQRVSIPKNKMSLLQYFQAKPGQYKTIAGLLRIGLNKNQDCADLFADISEKIGIGNLSLNTQIPELSLTLYNRIRFMKFLTEINAKLLVIDEMAVGMSFSEAANIMCAFRMLVNSKYTVLAIEHSLPVITASDYIVEMGPGAGTQGGYVTFCGYTSDYKATAGWINIINSLNKELPSNKIEHKLLKINDINYHGLNIAEFTMPSFCIVNVFGLAGTGKSTLIDIVYRAFDKSVNAWKNRAGIEGGIDGKNYVRRPYFIDQSPIGNNSMSTPATYTKIMDILRDMYAHTDESVKNSLSVADFSYNSDGKCEVCGGKGVKELSVGEETVLEPCSSCNGSRYRKAIEQVLINGLSIGDMLKLQCGDLIEHCADRQTLRSKVGFIIDVGLSYITLGQPSTSLSGGESQRIKITKELAKKLGDRCLFILDTPSKGLHINDFENMLIMLRKLVSKNNSVLICDNNPYFVRNSDWVICVDTKGITYQGSPKTIPRNIVKMLGLKATL